MPWLPAKGVGVVESRSHKLTHVRTLSCQPFLNSVSSFPRIVDSILGRAAYVNHALFEKYGPVVRVEPNMIILADPKYIKTIYGYGSGFYKTEVRIVVISER